MVWLIISKNQNLIRLAFGAFAIAIVLAAAYGNAPAQASTTRYLYDDSGRLYAVISPTGEANIYEYDASGNITAIRRNTANTLELLDFSPREGVPGDQVTIVGTGFGAGVNAVAFNGVAAQILSFSVTLVIVIVPAGATTGPISVTTPGGTGMTAKPFTVRGLQVTPSVETILSRQALRFSAIVTGPADQSVIWSVDGIAGGGPHTGTITAMGEYVAPSLPSGQLSALYRIHARSVAEPDLVGEARLRVLNPDSANAAFGPPVLVRMMPANGVLTASPVGAGVTVRISPSAEVLPVSISSRSVKLTTGPNVTGVSPGAFTRGASATITIQGLNLGGATTVRFMTTSGALDSNITISGLTLNGDGTLLMATVTVAGSAALGTRIAVVLSPAGHSQTASLVANTIQIVQ